MGKPQIYVFGQHWHPPPPREKKRTDMTLLILQFHMMVCNKMKRRGSSLHVIKNYRVP
jgi:hypothetical protein